MKLTLNDLTVNFRHLNREALLSDWQWLLGTQKLPILLAAIGNAFVQDAANGTVHVLDVGSGELGQVAQTAEEFNRLLKDPTFAKEYLAAKAIAQLRIAGRALKAGQIYSFKVLPILGGTYELDNLEAADIEVHFSMAGQIHDQVSKLPPGTKISDIQFR